MDADFSRIKNLVDKPSESLAVEIKRWIDPETPEGKEKIIKAVLALRNNNGGYLVIGFDNDTLEPDIQNIPGDIKGLFHIDKIQEMISKYASDPFEVSVEFPDRDGQPYPVIIVPPGLRTIVAAKSELKDGSRTLININDVYVRTLRSNNRPSTAKVGWKDWPRILEICFDNREADIGRFLRRHLSGITPEVVKEFSMVLKKAQEPEIKTEELLKDLLYQSKERYQNIIKERKLTIPVHGSWEVALIFFGDVPSHSANQDFLSLLNSSNPHYTGWPVWLESRGWEPKDRPYVFQGVWEALIANIGMGILSQIEFMRLDPKGQFYLKRALQEDIAENDRFPAPLSVLEIELPIIRTAEAITVGISFAKAMGCNPENTMLAFAFKWTMLKGRKLIGRSHPFVSAFPQRAYQEEVTVTVDVPLETPLSALGEFVNQAVKPLLEAFEGFTLNKNKIEGLTRRLIDRKL